MRLSECIMIRFNISLIRLHTNQRFAENIRLYLALGYRIDREEQSALGIMIHMSKPVRA